MNSMLGWVAASAVLVTMMLVPGTHASMYEDILMQDLMKRLSEYEADPYANVDWYADDNIPLEARDNGETNIRDQEYLQHSASHQGGFQYIQGGAGEGQQHLTPSGSMPNEDVIKSDESLPFYCHPPNPCPKGYTAEDGCDPDTENLDTAEVQKNWIDTMMARGMCTCDEEHMFTCPSTVNTIDSAKGQAAKSELDDMLDSFLNEKSNSINPYAGGDKRITLVAKKSPIVKRSIDDSRQMDPNDLPLFMRPLGDSAHYVVKKAGPFPAMPEKL